MYHDIQWYQEQYMPFKADIMLHLHSPFEFALENKSSDNPQTGRQSQGEGRGCRASGYRVGSGESPSNVTYTCINHALLLKHKDLSLLYAHMAQTIWMKIWYISYRRNK